MQDWRLLNQYVQNGSQAAFTELIERYQKLVYATCLRETGDRDLAEDATQVVFLILARKASTFRRNVILTGWLFQTARFTAKDVLARERRRRIREHKIAHEMSNEMRQHGESAWKSIDPLLNGALARLSSLDREALLLRYFEGRTLPETGEVLQISEEAARKRVNRAVGKLRDHFAHQGIVLSGAVVASVLAANAVQAVPETCAAGLMQLAARHAAGHAGLGLGAAKIEILSKEVMKAMTGLKLKMAAMAVSTVLAGSGGAALIAHAAGLIGQRPIAAKKVKAVAAVPASKPAAAMPPTPAPLPALAKLQLHDGFTIVYNVVETNDRTQAMIDDQVRGLALSYDLMVKNGSIKQAQMDEAMAADRQWESDKSPRKYVVTVSFRDGASYCSYRQTGGLSEGIDRDGKRKPYAGRTELYDGINTYTPYTAKHLTIEPGLRNMALEFNLLGVSFPGLPIAVANTGKQGGVVPPGGHDCKILDLRYGPSFNPEWSYRPAVVWYRSADGGLQLTKAVEGDPANPELVTTYDRHRRLQGVWLSGHLHRTLYFHPYHFADEKPIPPGPETETDVTVVSVSGKPLAADKFNPRTYLSSGARVSKWDGDKSYSIIYNPNGGDFEAQHAADVARQAVSLKLSRDMGEAAGLADATLHGNGQDGHVILRDAESRAKAEGKNVFLVFHATWCVPCRFLHHFLNDPEVKPVIDAHYVVLEEDMFENARDGWENAGALDILKQYGGGNGGIPFTAILDPSGKKLADSDYKGNNIGMPDSVETMGVFMDMLRKTSSGVSDGDWAALATVMKRQLPR